MDPTYIDQTSMIYLFMMEMSPNKAPIAQKGPQTILIWLGPKLVRSGWHIIYNYVSQSHCIFQTCLKMVFINTSHFLSF